MGFTVRLKNIDYYFGIDIIIALINILNFDIFITQPHQKRVGLTNINATVCFISKNLFKASKSLFSH